MSTGFGVRLLQSSPSSMTFLSAVLISVLLVAFRKVILMIYKVCVINYVTVVCVLVDVMQSSSELPYRAELSSYYFLMDNSVSMSSF